MINYLFLKIEQLLFFMNDKKSKNNVSYHIQIFDLGSEDLTERNSNSIKLIISRNLFILS